MPITNVNSSADKGPGGGGRTTFRPPWVKGEGTHPQPVPMPTQPWSKRNSLTTEAPKENGQSSQKEVKLQSREVKVPITTTTKKSLAQPLKKKEDKKEDVEEKTSIGGAENSGKFVRPVLKKVAKVEESTKPPGKVAAAAADKKNVKEPVGKSKPPVAEESSEEEEESSYEEVTETETETDSDEPPPPITNKKPPVKEESTKQVAAPTKPVSTQVVKPPLTRQISAKNAPVEKPAIPASHARFTPPKSPFSKKVVTNTSLEQPSPPVEPNKSLLQNSKIQKDVQKDLSKDLPKLIPKKDSSKDRPKDSSKDLPKEVSKELPKEISKEISKEVSKAISNQKSPTQTKQVTNTDDKVPMKPSLLKQNSVKPIQSPNQIQKNATAAKPEPEIPKTTETPKLTTEPTEQKIEINKPINKKFGLNTGKSTETKAASESKSVPEKTASEKIVPSKQVTLKPIPEKPPLTKSSSKSTITKPELKPIPPKPETIPESKQLPTKSSLKPIPPKPEPLKSDGTKAAPPPPPPPPSFGAPPPPPPPPGLAPPAEFERKPITEKHKQMLEKLKTRPRRRPDWSDMMKEVESGRKLKHVQCNDRSSPIISCKSVTNIQGQYIFETEKANVHNVLLKQIQGGVRLKPTKTNDRSRPILAGLRKFRRQMTIEEQIQKSESRAQLNVEAPVEESEDEMDDIDKLRDDLQSTKQMLALELRNKEAQERENKRLLARVQILEAELEREKWQPIPSATDNKESTTAPASEALLQNLKKEAEDAQKTSKLLEKKYQEAADQLDSVKTEVERQKITIANMERRLAQQAGGVTDTTRRQSEVGQKDSSPEPELELSEEEEDEDEEKKAERVARRLQREVKMLCTKLIRLKDKERAAKRERENLRDAMKKNQGLLKIEHKKFKKLQREVDKMAAMMKEDDEGNGSDDDSKPAAEEPEVDEDEESEDEEEESDSEDESDGDTDNESESEAEDATDENKKINYEPRIKRHDGRVSALKKGNYLLQANVDRLQDEINKMREKSVSLQRDLDSVLSELG